MSPALVALCVACSAWLEVPPANLHDLAASPLCGPVSGSKWTVRLEKQGVVTSSEWTVVARSDYTFFHLIETPGDRFPVRFVELNKDGLRNGGDGNRYSDHKVTEDARSFPGMNQLLFHPWPVLSPWLDALERTPDIQREMANGRERISSAKIGFSLEYESASGKLTLQRGADNEAHTRVTFDKLPANGEAGSSFTQELSIPGKPSIIWRGSLKEFVAEPDQAQALAKFDPASRGMDQFDPVTSDVHGPDGKLRYNENELMARLDGNRGWLREHPAVVWVAVSAVALGACGVYIRRKAHSRNLK